MEAIFENGSIKEDNRAHLIEALLILNALLHFIKEADDSDELIQTLDKANHKFRKQHRKAFPFKYGLCSSGIEIYYGESTTRLILVPCETNIEL